MTLGIRNSAEALFMAVEMEKRAIRMYERMLLVVNDATSTQVIKHLLKDEIEHLERFQTQMSSEAVSGEDAMLLSARANDILFAGGLTQAAREGAFDSPQSILKYAMEQEDTAVKTYLDLAKKSTGAAKMTFQDISSEEKDHFDALMDLFQSRA